MTDAVEADQQSASARPNWHAAIEHLERRGSMGWWDLVVVAQLEPIEPVEPFESSGAGATPPASPVEEELDLRAIRISSRLSLHRSVRFPVDSL